MRSVAASCRMIRLMRRQIFYISFSVSTNWALLLVGRLNKVTNPDLKARYERLWKSELYPIALSLEAKLSKLPSVMRGVDQAIRELSKEFEARTAEIDRCIADYPRALVLRNDSLGFTVSANIESYLYHLQSAYELARRFFIRFNRAILERRATEYELKAVLENAGLDCSWIDVLKAARRLSAHESALWCDVEKVSDDPRRYELLISAIHSVDPEKYLTIAQYRDLYAQFGRALARLQKWLLGQIDVIDGAAK
jgi:hypothetical protein